MRSPLCGLVTVQAAPLIDPDVVRLKEILMSARAPIPEEAAVSEPTPAHHRARPHRQQEDLLDEAIEESFPASDPIAVIQLLSSR
jgi:hypothetical protein